jgi:general stress protein YciG
MSFKEMDPGKHRDVCSKGGKAAHAAGKAYQFTPEKAREAGRKGGLAPRRPRVKKSDAPAQ